MDGSDAVSRGTSQGSNAAAGQRPGSRGWSPRTAGAAQEAWRSTGEAGNSPASTPGRQPSDSMQMQEGQVLVGAGSQLQQDGAREDPDSDLSDSDLAEAGSLARLAAAPAAGLQSPESEGSASSHPQAGALAEAGPGSVAWKVVGHAALPDSAAALLQGKLAWGGTGWVAAGSAKCKQREGNPDPSTGAVSALERLASKPGSPAWQIAAVATPGQRQQASERPLGQQAAAKALRKLVDSDSTAATMEVDVAPEAQDMLPAQPEVGGCTKLLGPTAAHKQLSGRPRARQQPV